MKCELCSEPGTARITDVEGGKVTERQLCPRHTAELLGGPTPEAWESFIGQIASQFKARGMLPTVAEIAQFGDIGSRLTQSSQPPHTRLLEFLETQVHKRLAS